MNPCLLKSEWWLFLGELQVGKVHDGSLRGARSVPYLDLGREYMGAERSKKIIRLSNEHNYTLCLTVLGCLSVKDSKVGFL